MTTITAFVPNTAILDFALEDITNAFPCFIEREFAEMDHSKISVACRDEDADAVGRRLTVALMLS